MYTNELVDELSMKFRGFDFENAMQELIKWKGELKDTDYDDAVTISVLDGVIDLIIDNCTF